ncbi:DinB family protein [Brevibacterium linens]|uniref:DinB family protein n=1 Tax=Brevibacterium linens TaxID=1703 RepID=UPI00351796C2
MEDLLVAEAAVDVLQGDHVSTLCGGQRERISRKDEIGTPVARRSPVPTGTNLGGLIKHLRWVELGAFAEQIGQIPAAELPTPPWSEEDPEADLRLEPHEKLDDVIGAYQAECDRSRAIAAQHSLDYSPQGSELTLRWVYLHLILETGRHAGHADILRELIDRTVGD